jgi:ribosomal-protein-alanine N-acetyltransferase
MYPIRLTGQKIVLREFRPDDVGAVHAVVGDDRVTSWLSFESRDRTQAETMVYGAIKRARDPRRAEYYLAVAPHSTEQLVGFVRLALDGIAAGKLGYAIGADHWGNGYASEATSLLVTFGFETLQLHRISAAIGPENNASIAVAARLGMSYEGRIRHHVRTNGEWRDSLLYSVLVDEWRRRVAFGDQGDPDSATDWEHGAAG